MKNLLSKFLGSSWRTTGLGIVAIIIGLRSASVLWVHSQTLYFNVFYVIPGPLALLIVGWALIHARDHRAKD